MPLIYWIRTSAIVDPETGVVVVTYSAAPMSGPPLTDEQVDEILERADKALNSYAQVVDTATE